MPQVELTQNLITTVDAEDYEKVSQYSWYASNNSGRFYAARRGRKGEPRTVYLHRWLLGFPVGVDHINGDSLNNQRDNLRIATQAQNLTNRRPKHRFKGVRFNKGKYEAYTKENGRYRYIGRYSTPEEAALNYNKVVSSIYGEFAYLNKVGG